jgi:hypothetical protein
MSLDNLSVQDFLTALNIDYERVRDQAPPEQAFPYGNRVALIAPPNAGKTANVCGIFMRAQRKVADTVNTDTPFYCRVLEKGSNIHQDISNLMDGYFPAKTRSYLGFRSSPGLLLEQKKFVGASIPLVGRIVGRNIRPRKQLWHKMLQLPICDLPGETLSKVMWQYRALSGAEQAVSRRMIEDSIREMRESEAYIFILKASLAKGFGKQLEEERDPNVSRDPDVNLVRMLSDLANYKMRQGKEIKAAYVIISAWDKLKPLADRVGFDLLDPYIGQQEIDRFVKSAFPQFYAELHSARIPLIQYYPTFFQTETNEKGEEILFKDPMEIREPNGTVTVTAIERPHIITKDALDPEAPWYQNARRISCSDQQFDNLLNDLMKLAVAN